MPAVAPSKKISNPVGESSRNSNAGTVKITPAASDSPADAIVCTTLFSRTVPRLRMPRRIAIDSTAEGIDVETVRPIFSARFELTIPKVSESSAPSTTARTVSSALRSVGAT
jgi:hypothetical protein